MKICKAALILLCVGLMGPNRTTSAQEQRAGEELLQVMTASAAIRTDDSFDTLKKRLGYLPEVVAPEGFRSFAQRSDLPFRKLRGGLGQVGTVAALFWAAEAETNTNVADVLAHVRSHLAEEGYSEGSAPPEAFFQTQYEMFGRNSTELLTFRKGRPRCTEVVTIVINDRNSRPESKVRVGVQWAVVTPLEQPLITHQMVTTAFPMLRSFEVDRPLADSIADALVLELSASLQMAGENRHQSPGVRFGPGNWSLEASGDLRPVLEKTLADVGFIAGDAAGQPAGIHWKRGTTESARLTYSKLLQRSWTKLAITRFPTAPSERATAPENASNTPVQTPPPRSRLRPGRSRFNGPSGNPRPVKDVLSDMVRSVKIDSDESFEVYKQTANLTRETAAPEGMRRLLLQPDLGLTGLEARVVRDDAGLTITWAAEARIDTELSLLADQLQERMARLSLQKLDVNLGSERLPLELNLLSRRAKVLQAYERSTNGTTEFVVVALSDGSAEKAGTGVAVLWSVESNVELLPVILADVLQQLPTLRPEGLDAEIIEALSRGPLQAWERGFALNPRLDGTSFPGVLQPFQVWKFHTRQDLRTEVTDGLTSVGFVGSPPLKEGAAGTLAQTWKRTGVQASVYFSPVRSEAGMDRPDLTVTVRRDRE